MGGFSILFICHPGPFEMVLCVGSFFGAAGDDGDAAVWKALLAGERRVPMPVYLLGPNNQEKCTLKMTK